MGKLFGNTQNAAQVTPRDALQNKYNSARANLIFVVAFTLINIILLFTESSSYFLFSLFIPYMLVLLGASFTGNLPGVYVAPNEILPDTVFYIMAAIAAAFLAVFVVGWILSKKNKAGWLVAALVLACIDTAIFLLMGGLSMDSLIDILFHIWVIVSLAGGISAHKKLKALPPEEEIVDTTAEVVEDGAPAENSPILRSGYLDEKYRVLLEAEKDGLYITYRRVKKTNELVINSNVYDEYTALMEMPHTLCATFAGHKIEAGCDTASRSFIKIDGEIVAKKLRLV